MTPSRLFQTLVIVIILAFVALPGWAGDVQTSTALSSATRTAPRQVAFGDVTGDANIDAVVGFSGQICVFVGDGTSPFPTPTAETACVAVASNFAIAIGEVTGDAIADIVVSSGRDIVLLTNNPKGTFTASTAENNAADASNTISGIILIDADNDGDTDIVATDTNDTVIVDRNAAGFGGGAVKTNVTGAGSLTGGLASVGDISTTPDSLPELAVADGGNSRIFILTNAGAGAFTAAPLDTITTTTAPTGIVSADFDGDGDLDVAASLNTAGSGVGIALSAGAVANPFPAAATEVAVTGTPRDIGAGDFTADGSPDLAVSTTSGGVGLLNNGAGVFTAEPPIAAGTTPQGIAVADLHGDGLDDVAIANNGSDDVSIFLVSGFSSVNGDNPQPGGADPFEGVPFSGIQVANFNYDLPVTTAEFTATIDWGDGSVSPGDGQPVTITGGAGVFGVSGNHTYSDPLATQTSPYTITVTISNTTPGVFTVSPGTAPTATVQDTPIEVSPPATADVNGNPGLLSYLVANFHDDNTTSDATHYDISVDWGDTTSDNCPAPCAGVAQTASGPGGKDYGVTLSHNYAAPGTYTVITTITDAESGGTETNTVSISAFIGTISNLVPTPIAGFTEGTPATGVLAFDSSRVGAAAGEFSISVDWGDSTPLDVCSAPCADVSGPVGSTFTLSRNHTYNNETDGTPYNVTYTVTDISDASVGTVGTTATITQAVISVTANPVARNEGQLFTGVIASFTDPSAASPSADYAATIDWGDATSTTCPSATCTITSAGGGSYNINIVGTGKRYLNEGLYPITVDVTDQSFGPYSDTDTATIADVGPVAGATTFTVGTLASPLLVGVDSFSGNVAEFTDPSGTEVAGSFTAMINWGDGSPDTAGTITTVTPGVPGTTAGVFRVNASGTPHTFTNVSTTVTITISEADGTPATIIVVDTAFTTSISAVTATPFAATEGTAFLGAVGSFTSNRSVPAPAAGEFSLVISWGDGSPDTVCSAPCALVSGAGPSFTISGTPAHIYTHFGSYPVNITVTDIIDGSSRATAAPATASVADAPLINSDFHPAVSGTEGSALNGGVPFDIALWEDTNPFATPADYTSGTGSMIVNWGDGTSSPADGGPVNVRILFGCGGASPCVFMLSSTHTYTEHGPYGTEFVVTSDGGASITINPGGATLNVSIADAPLTTPTPAAVVGTEGLVLSGGAPTTVATFVDDNPFATPADYTTGTGSVTINWGDGSPTSPGDGQPVSVVVQSGCAGVAPCVMAVRGIHTYTEHGSYGIQVDVLDMGGSALTINPGGATLNASIADAPLTPGAPVALAGTEGTALSGVVVGTFTDGNPYGLATDFTANIDWGDTTSSAGTVTVLSGCGGVAPCIFQVTGTHTYAAFNPAYAISVGITDIGGSTATLTGSAAIADAALTANAPPAIVGVEGAVLNVSVGSVLDANPSGVASDLSAIIDWGDGTATSAGTVTGAVGGPFDVSGSHQYTAAGTYGVEAAVTSLGGSIATINPGGAVLNATISDAPFGSFIANCPDIPAVPCQKVTPAGRGVQPPVLFGTFTDTNPFGLASQFTATIDWNDGTVGPAFAITPVGCTAAGCTFEIYGDHQYAVPDVTFAVHITIHSLDGAPDLNVIVFLTSGEGGGGVGAPPYLTTVDTPTITVRNGQNAVYDFTLTPLSFPAGFPFEVTFSCIPPLPQGVTCVFNPPSVPDVTVVRNMTLTVHTTAPSAALRPPLGGAGPMLAYWLPASGLGMFGLMLAGSGGSRKRRVLFWTMVSLLFITVAAVGCGGGGATFGPVPTGDTSTPLGSQAIRIQFSSPTAPAGQQTQTFTVIVAVTP